MTNTNEFEIIEQVKTTVGTFDISKMGENYTVQLNGDEVVFETVEEAKEGICDYIVSIYWNDAPYEYVRWVDNKMLQAMLEYINENDERRNLFESVLTGGDEYAIRYVIRDNYYETFDRFDSDVCEQFIVYYQEFEDCLLDTIK